MAIRSVQEYLDKNFLDCRIEQFRTTLAASGVVREFLCGESPGSVLTESEALANIYDGVLPPPEDGESYSVKYLQELAPWVLLYPNPDQASRLELASGDFSTYTDSGVLVADFERFTPAEFEKDAAAAEHDLTRYAGGILEELSDLAVDPDHFKPTTLLAVIREQFEFSDESGRGRRQLLNIVAGFGEGEL